MGKSVSNRAHTILFPTVEISRVPRIKSRSKRRAGRPAGSVALSYRLSSRLKLTHWEGGGETRRGAVLEKQGVSLEDPSCPFPASLFRRAAPSHLRSDSGSDGAVPTEPIRVLPYLFSQHGHCQRSKFCSRFIGDLP